MVFKTLSFLLNPRTLSEGFTETLSSEGYKYIVKVFKPSCHKRVFGKLSDLKLKPSEGFVKPSGFKEFFSEFFLEHFVSPTRFLCATGAVPILQLIQIQ